MVLKFLTLSVCLSVRLQGRPVACGQDGEELHAAAQPAAAGGGGVHWPQPVAPLPAPQQGHAHEEPEEGGAVHLVRQEAMRDQPA